MWFREKKEYQELTCKWLFTSSLVKPSTCISSLICFGVAAAGKESIRLMNQTRCNIITAHQIYECKISKQNHLTSTL